ncbi:MAG: tetratricopeptide repeat protein, partial [Flammeovirgaceae bacterium]
MKFFSKLFGGSKKQEAAHKTTSDEQFIEIFMSRSQLWDLSFTPEVIQMGLNQCKAQAAEDDKIYKLPELYGSMVIYKAEQGDQQSLEFLNRALEHGATAEDFAQWWNSEDLMRRMLEWELNMRKHKLFVEIQGADATIDDELAIIKVRKLLPEFGEPTQYFGEGKLDKFLPVELQFRVDQIIRELGAEKRLEIAAQESSFNAYLYKRLMPETHYAEVDYLKEVANQAFDAFEQGEIQKAGELAKEFKILAVKEWGARDTNLVMNLRLFANIFAANGDYLEAQYCLEEFIEVFGEAHEHYLETLTSLGQVYLELGNVAEAIQTQQKAYDLQKHQPDPTGLLPRILNNYALALSTHEKYEEAIPFYQEALKGIEEKYGKNNELYALYLSNLCAAFCQNNQYDEALSPCLESMNIRKELLGEEHPDFAESLENLAVIDVVLGEYDEALRLIQKVHDIRKRILGEQHPDYALSLMHLGITYQHVGNLAEAYDCLKQAVDVRLKQLKVIIPSLAERAKDAFLESIKFDFNLFIAFSVSHLSTFPESTFHLTNMRLATKGILLETSQDLSKRVYNTNNDFLISAYE